LKICEPNGDGSLLFRCKSQAERKQYLIFKTTKMAKPDNHGKKWTSTEISLLKKQAKKDVPTTKIAKDLKRTEASIRAKAQEEKIKLGKPN